MAVTTPQDAREVLARARDGMKRLSAEEPDNRWYASILAQLDVVETGVNEASLPDVTKEKLNFGFLGVRFVDEVDEALAEDLAQLSQFVKQRL